MKRVYYLAPDLSSVESISTHLHANGIRDWQFHVVSKDEAGLSKRHIHSAGFIHRLDILHSMEKGLLCGGLLGASFIAAFYFSADNALKLPQEMSLSGIMLSIFIFCALAGTWIGGMAGVNQEHYKLRRFHNAIDQGLHLLMIDIPALAEEDLRDMMTKHNPEAVPQGRDTTHDNPFIEEDGKFHLV